MSHSSTVDYGYGFTQQNAADEAYFAAGTHRLPQTPSIPSTRQIEQDIDAGLQQFTDDVNVTLAQSTTTTQTLDDQLDLSNFLSLSFDETWMEDLTSPAMAITTAASFNSSDNFIPAVPKRIDSGLRATAPPFIPNQQWQNQQSLAWLPPTNSTLPSQSRNRNRMSHMTPLQTNMATSHHTLPLSAPSRPIQHATSPLISLTDDSCFTSIPPVNVQGYQWEFTTPPALDIDTWAHSTRDFVDSALLTPITPVTPTYGGSDLQRTASRTSRTSRTTAGPYMCDHEGCGKEFKSKQDFAHHKRNHGERHHVCAVCHRKFVFRKDLGRHERVHTDERSMFGPTVEGCTWCAKGFQRKDHYERHMKTHLQKGEALTPAGSSAGVSRTHSRQRSFT